jgi:hypothetical protein
MKFLQRASSSSHLGKSNFSKAKLTRNLWVHFTPKRDGEAFDSLSLGAVEEAASELAKWMSEVGTALGLDRHPDSEEVALSLGSKLGRVKKSISSDS